MVSESGNESGEGKRRCYHHTTIKRGAGQFTKMFADCVDADRDTAGIVANRWGHAHVVRPPHFYFGKNGQPAPRDVVREGYGRIRFAHSELEGTQMWETAIHEGERAVRQVLELD